MPHGAENGTRERDVSLLDTPHAGPAAIRGGAVRLAGYGAGVLLSVGSAALLFRHLGVVDGGRYVTIIALVATVQGLTDFGLTAIGVRELAVREGEAKRELVRSLLGLRIALTGVGVAGAVAFAWIAGYGAVLVAGTALAGVGLVVQNLQTTLGLSLMADLRLGWVTLMELVRQVVTVVLITALVIAGAELLPFFAIPIPAALVALILTALLLRREISTRPSFDRAEWTLLLRDVLPFAASTAVASVYFRLAIVLLSLISTADQTGYFAAPFRVVEVLVVVPSLLVTAAFPIFARAAVDDHERLGYGVQRVFEVCTLLGAWIALFLVVGADLVIDVVAGPEFAPSETVLRIQAVTVFALFASSAWSYALLGLREHAALLVITLATLAVNCVLVVLLGSSDGARGAAIGTFVADLVGLVALGAWLSARHRALRPSLGVFPKVAVAAGGAAALALIPGFSGIPLLVAASSVYLALVFLLRAVPEEVLVELKRLRGAPAS